MNRRPQKIIGINPGTRYLGLTVLDGSELLDWRIKVFPGKWTKEKMNKMLEVISGLIEKYRPRHISLKKLHSSRSSKNLKTLVSKIVAIAKRNKIKVVRYSIQEIEILFLKDKKHNKRNIAERIALDYPALIHEIKKEKRNRNPYYIRAFEAVALGIACFYQ
jgi:Holliday junction resolvasome RuvABC endonuclease subunit